MNFTSLFLLKTLLSIGDLTLMMDKILMSNKIRNVVIYYQNHTLDAANAVLLNKHASQKTFSIVEYTMDSEELKKTTKHTFFVYLVDIQTFYFITQSYRYIQLECRHLFVLYANQNIVFNKIVIKFWLICNMAIVYWVNDKILVAVFYFHNLTVGSKRIDNIQNEDNLYDNMFRDNVLLENPKKFTFYLMANWIPPNEMEVTDIIGNKSYYFGHHIYLFKLLADQFGVMMAPIITFRESFRIQKTYKNCMMGHVVDPKTVPAAESSAVYIFNFIRHSSLASEIYPYDSEKLVLLVPNELIASSLLTKLILESPLLTVWSITIILISTIRICLQTNNNHWNSDISSIVLDTFSVAFAGSGYLLVTKRPERILIVSLSIFFLLSSILCTDFIFQQYTTQAMKPTINSLEDLNNSNIQISGNLVYLTWEMQQLLEQS